MSETLAAVGLDLVETGLMPGIPQDKVPLWADARNVIFDRYGARPAPGYGAISLESGLFDDQAGNFDDAAGLFDALTTGAALEPSVGEEIRGLATTQQVDGQRAFIYGTLTKLYLNTGTQDDVSRAGGYDGLTSALQGAPATYWSFADWGEWVLATNGTDEPQIYKPSADFIDIADAQCDWAQLVFVLGPHAILANTSNGYNAVEWSAQGDPEVFDFATNPTAGRRIIRTFPGPIIAAARLGPAYLLFGDTQAHVMQYGGQFTFSTLPGPQGAGAVSKNSVVSIGQRIYGIMRDGIFETDGVNFRWVTYPQFGRWLQDNVNWDQASKIAGWHDAEWHNIRWAIPTAGSAVNNLVIVYNYQTGRFSFETTAFTVGVERGRIGTPLIGNVNGQVRASRTDAAATSRWAETRPISVGQRGRLALVDVLTVLKSGTDFAVQVAWIENLSDTPTWETLGIADLDESIFYPSRESTYVKVRIECNDPAANWQIVGMELMGHLTGRRH